MRYWNRALIVVTGAAALMAYAQGVRRGEGAEPTTATKQTTTTKPAAGGGPLGAWPASPQSWVVPPQAVVPGEAGQPPLAFRQHGLVRTFLGFGAGVTDVAFSPDGRQLAASSGDGTVRVLELATGRQVCVCTGHRGCVGRVIFSPDGKELFSAGDDGTVRRWDATTGRQTREYRGHQQDVGGVAFEPKSNTLLTAGYDGKFILWDAAAGTQIKAVALNAVVESCAFSPDGKSYFVGTAAAGAGGELGEKDGVIRQYDLATGNEIQTFKGHGFAVGDIRVTADGAKLVTACRQDVIVYDVATAKVLGKYQMGMDTVNFDARVAHVKDLSHIYAAGGVALQGYNKDVLPTAGLSFSTDKEIHGVAVSPDDRYLAMAYGGNWNSIMGAQKLVSGDVHCVYLFDRKAYEQSLASLETLFPNARRLSALGANRLAIFSQGEGEGKVAIWDLAAKKVIREFGGLTQMQVLVGSPRGKFLACVMPKNVIQLLEVETGKVQKLEGHTGAVTGVAFRQDETTLYSAGGDGKVFAWDTATGVRGITLSKGDKPVGGVALLNGDAEVLSTVDGNLVRWRVSDQQVVYDAPQAVTLKNAAWAVSGVMPNKFPGTALLKFSNPKSKAASAFGYFDTRANRLIAGVTEVVGASSNTEGLADGRLLINDQIVSDKLERVSIGDGILRYVASSADGRSVHGIGWSNDVETESLRFTGGTTTAVLSPDRKMLFTGRIGSINIWNTASGQLMQRLMPEDVPPGRWFAADVSVSADGGRAVTISSDSVVRVWDTKTGAQLKAIKGLGESSKSAISPDGKWVAVSASDVKPTRVLNMETGAESAQIPQAGPNCRVTFSPDGRYVLVDDLATNDRPSMLVWDLKEKRVAVKVTGPFVSEKPAAFGKDGTLLLFNQGQEAGISYISFTQRELWKADRARMPALNAIISPNGAWGLFYCEDHTVRLLNMETSRQVMKWPTSSETLEQIAFTPDNQALVLLDNQSLVVFNPTTAKETARLEVRVLFQAQPLVLPDGTFAVMDARVGHTAIYPLAGPKWTPQAAGAK